MHFSIQFEVFIACLSNCFQFDAGIVSHWVGMLCNNIYAKNFYKFNLGRGLAYVWELMKKFIKRFDSKLVVSEMLK